MSFKPPFDYGAFVNYVSPMRPFVMVDPFAPLAPRVHSVGVIVNEQAPVWPSGSLPTFVDLKGGVRCDMPPDKDRVHSPPGSLRVMKAGTAQPVFWTPPNPLMLRPGAGGIDEFGASYEDLIAAYNKLRPLADNEGLYSGHRRKFIWRGLGFDNVVCVRDVNGNTVGDVGVKDIKPTDYEGRLLAWAKRTRPEAFAPPALTDAERLAKLNGTSGVEFLRRAVKKMSPREDVAETLTAQSGEWREIVEILDAPAKESDDAKRLADLRARYPRTAVERGLDFMPHPDLCGRLLALLYPNG